jgi:hypothetical protein
VQNYNITVVDNSEFHIGGLPADAEKVISLAGLYPQGSESEGVQLGGHLARLERELSDIGAHRQDLTFAAQSLEQLAATPDLPPIVQEATWRSAVTHYCKCFAQRGSRKPLPYKKYLPHVQDSDARPREIHKYMISLRNKNLVHDENGWRQVQIGAVISAQGKGYNVEKVVCNAVIAQTLNQGNFGNLFLLLNSALEWTALRFETLCNEIAAELEKLDREALLDQPNLEYRAPIAEEIHLSRAELPFGASA